MKYRWGTGILFLTMLLGALGVSQALKAGVHSDGPQVGDKAPPLYLTKLLNGPTNAQVSLEALKGKVVVLDFWATWCAPCLRTIPHVNRLVEELKAEPVQFIAITAEPEDVVRPFLKRNPLAKYQAQLTEKDKSWTEPIVKAFEDPNPIKAWVALDDLTGRDPTDYDAGRTVSGYFFRGVPHCVLVDKEGFIAAYLHPMDVTAELLRDIAAGKHREAEAAKLTDEERKRWTEFRKQQAKQVVEASQPQFTATIQRAREWKPFDSTWGHDVYWGQWGDRMILRTTRFSLAEALEKMNELRSPDGVIRQRFVAKTSLPSSLYEFHINTPKSLFADAFAMAVEASFPVKVRKEQEMLDVHFLRVAEGKTHRLQKPKDPRGKSRRMRNGGHLEFQRGDMRDLAMKLYELWPVPVIDETRLEEEFDFSLTVNARADIASIRKALQEQLGLDLVPDKTPVSVYYLFGEGEGR